RLSSSWTPRVLNKPRFNLRFQIAETDDESKDKSSDISWPLTETLTLPVLSSFSPTASDDGRLAISSIEHGIPNCLVPQATAVACRSSRRLRIRIILAPRGNWS